MAAAGGAVSCSSVYSILYPVLYLEPSDVHREALLGDLDAMAVSSSYSSFLLLLLCLCFEDLQAIGNISVEENMM